MQRGAGSGSVLPALPVRGGSAGSRVGSAGSAQHRHTGELPPMPVSQPKLVTRKDKVASAVESEIDVLLAQSREMRARFREKQEAVLSDYASVDRDVRKQLGVLPGSLEKERKLRTAGISTGPVAAAKATRRKPLPKHLRPDALAELERQILRQAVKADASVELDVDKDELLAEEEREEAERRARETQWCMHQPVATNQEDEEDGEEETKDAGGDVDVSAPSVEAQPSAGTIEGGDGADVVESKADVEEADGSDAAPRTAATPVPAGSPATSPARPHASAPSPPSGGRNSPGTGLASWNHQPSTMGTGQVGAPGESRRRQPMRSRFDARDRLFQLMDLQRTRQEEHEKRMLAISDPAERQRAQRKFDRDHRELHTEVMSLFNDYNPGAGTKKERAVGFAKATGGGLGPADDYGYSAYDPLYDDAPAEEVDENIEASMADDGTDQRDHDPAAESVEDLADGDQQQTAAGAGAGVAVTVAGDDQEGKASTDVDGTDAGSAPPTEATSAEADVHTDDRPDDDNTAETKADAEPSDDADADADAEAEADVHRDLHQSTFEADEATEAVVGGRRGPKTQPGRRQATRRPRVSGARRKRRSTKRADSVMTEEEQERDGLRAPSPTKARPTPAQAHRYGYKTKLSHDVESSNKVLAEHLMYDRPTDEEGKLVEVGLRDLLQQHTEPVDYTYPQLELQEYKSLKDKKYRIPGLKNEFRVTPANLYPEKLSRKRGGRGRGRGGRGGRGRRGRGGRGGRGGPRPHPSEARDHSQTPEPPAGDSPEPMPAPVVAGGGGGGGGGGGAAAAADGHGDQPAPPSASQIGAVGADGDLGDGRGPPLLLVDINITPTRVASIPLWEDQDCEEAAHQFLVSEGLNMAMKPMLTSMLAEQRADVIASRDDAQRREQEEAEAAQRRHELIYGKSKPAEGTEETKKDDPEAADPTRATKRRPSEELAASADLADSSTYAGLAAELGMDMTKPGADDQQYDSDLSELDNED